MLRNEVCCLATVQSKNIASRHVIDDYEVGDVHVSLLTVQLRCAFDADAVFLQALPCEVHNY